MSMRKLTIKVGLVETGICKWIVVLLQRTGPARSSVGNVAGKGHLFIAARIAKQTVTLLVNVRSRRVHIAQIAAEVICELLLCNYWDLTMS